MELKHGIEVEKNTEKSVLKEFEVLPATVGAVIRATDKSNGSEAKLQAAIIVERIKIKGLPDSVWSAGILEQMSLDDFEVMREEIEKFDANFTFSPPSIRI